MKSRDDRFRHRHSSHNFSDAFAHLCSGFIREGDRENGFRHGPEVLDQVRNSVGDDACFSAARPGQDEHGTIRGFNSLALLRVQLGEERQRRNGSGNAG